MKKLLSIILAILMIVTSVPFAFAAGDGEKTVLDISTGKIVIADSYVSVGEENIEVDPDGYIITGSSSGEDTALRIINNSGAEATFNLVFRNLNIYSGNGYAAFVITDNDPVVLNIICEGNNKISADNYPAIVGGIEFARTEITVNITETEDSILEFERRTNDWHGKIYKVDDCYLMVFRNGKQLCPTGNYHEKFDGILPSCRGYRCKNCSLFFGEKDPDNHSQYGAQTCRGYFCILCNEHYGEKLPHQKGEQTCRGYYCYTCDGYYGEKAPHSPVGEQTCAGYMCETCYRFVGEKLDGAHEWEYGYCKNCSIKRPVDLACEHEYIMGFCKYCASVDGTCEELIDGNNIDGSYYPSSITDTVFNAFVFNYGQDEFNKLVENFQNETYSKINNIFEAGESLTGTVAENKEAIEKIIADTNDFIECFRNCLAGKHNFDEYKSNGDATCSADGTKTGDCTFCNDREITVTDEGSKLEHKDDDGDYICDYGCGHEFEKPAPEEPTPDTPDEPKPDTPDEPEDETCADCGKVHTNFFSELICYLIRIINFIKNLFA